MPARIAVALIMMSTPSHACGCQAAAPAVLGGGVAKRKMKIGGYEVPVANLPYTLSSDAGHLMGKGEPFAACYMDDPSGRTFSLRSSPEGVDVSEIAKAYGGGGHKNAAGFKMPIGWEGDGDQKRNGGT